MFFSVKFGDDEKALFNPDCAVQLLLDDIKKRCGCPKHIMIELVDEKGELANLSEHSPETSAPVFTNRGTYILLEVKKKDNDTVKYVPLLSGIAETYPELISRLEALSNPKSRVDGRGTKGRGTRPTARLATQQAKKKGTSSSMGESKSKSRLK